MYEMSAENNDHDIMNEIVDVKVKIAVLENDMGWIKQHLKELKKNLNKILWFLIVNLTSVLLSLITLIFR